MYLPETFVRIREFLDRRPDELTTKTFELALWERRASPTPGHFDVWTVTGELVLKEVPAMTAKQIVSTRNRSVRKIEKTIREA